MHEGVLISSIIVVVLIPLYSRIEFVSLDFGSNNLAEILLIILISSKNSLWSDNHHK